MSVHVLQESFGVFDGVVVSVPDAGECWGASGAYPPHALPRAFCSRHVLDFLVKEVFSRPCGDILKDLMIITAARVFINMFSELTFSSPPMRRV